MEKGHSPSSVLGDLWAAARCDPAALSRVHFTGDDPVLPGRFRVGTAAMASIAAAALAASECWTIRTGRRQDVALDARTAAATFRSERYLRVNGKRAGEVWNPVSGFYQAGDGRWIQLHCNFAHHRAGALRVLGVEEKREAVEAEIKRRKADELEDALAAAGMCAGMIRTRDEWRAHPQGRAVAELPLFEIIKIGDAAAQRPGQGRRPLSGVRALDLTRVIAGPVCGRTLAEHGADVLSISAPHVPHMDSHVMDNGRGKLSASLDLRRQEDVERLRELIRDADVFLQSYRAGALGARGFAPEDLARLRPGIVYATLNAYGHAGPWRERRGFDSLVQCVSGIAHEGGVAAGGDEPKHLPAQALDHATGFLLAFGIAVALGRRAREGGSWLVRVSLARTGRWFDGLGRADGPEAHDPGVEDVKDLLEETDTPFGRLSHVAPAARLSETPGRWARPAVPLGTHAPAWPPR